MSWFIIFVDEILARVLFGDRDATFIFILVSSFLWKLNRLIIFLIFLTFFF